MGRPIRRTVRLVRWLETALQNTGWFELRHDGQHGDQPESYGEPTFYTRTYQMCLDGQPVRTWIKFIYNLRDNWADFTISTKGVTDADKRVQMREAASRRLVRSLEASMESTTEGATPIGDLEAETREVW